MFDSVKSTIKEHALEEFPNECCGIIVEKDGKEQAIKCRNIATNKLKHFDISPIDYISGMKQGKFKAYYHSHNNTELSDSDFHCSSANGYPLICYSFKKKDFIEYNPTNQNINKFLGLQFELGKTDCLSLVRNYYKSKFNIEISDYFRDNSWYKKNPNIFLENYEKEGFIEINSLEQAQKSDLLLFRFSESEHLGILLGDDFLHHPRNKDSCCQPLTDAYKRRIVKIFRHKNLC